MSVTLNRTRHTKPKKPARYTKLRRTLRSMARNWNLYLLLVPVLAYFIIFHYAPMYGVQIAFRRYSIRKGIMGSQWVGMAHFNRFFQSYYFERLLVNTLTISLYNLALGFPLPILLALLLNEVTSKRYKKLVQTITYAPHFLSAVVLVSIINAMFSTSTGIINNLIVLMGGEKVAFTTEPKIFKSLYVLSGVWQNMGWNSIIYMAALSGIDPTLYEAGRVDGASRWQMLWRITLPCLAPTICIMLILQCGRLMSLGYEKIYLMQNDLNIAASEVISTYVYKSGLINAEYSFSTAVGLFNSVINCILLFTVNFITGKLSDTRIF